MKSVSRLLSSSVPVLQCPGAVYREHGGSVWDNHSSSWGETGSNSDLFSPGLSKLVFWHVLLCFTCQILIKSSVWLQKKVVFNHFSALLSGSWRPWAALRLLGADRFSSGWRCRQLAERRVGRGRATEQPAHADQRGERVQDPQGPLHRHPVLQRPLLQQGILRGTAQRSSCVRRIPERASSLVVAQPSASLPACADHSSDTGADPGGGRFHALQPELLWRAGVPDAVLSALPGDLHTCPGGHLLHRSVLQSRAVTHSQTLVWVSPRQQNSRTCWRILLSGAESNHWPHCKSTSDFLSAHLWL